MENDGETEITISKKDLLDALTEAFALGQRYWIEMEKDNWKKTDAMLAEFRRLKGGMAEWKNIK